MKKITVFLCFLALFTFVFIGSTYASEVEYPPIPQPDETKPYSDYIIIDKGDGTLTLKLYTSDKPLTNAKAYWFKDWPNGNKDFYYDISGQSITVTSYGYTSSSNNEWTLSGSISTFDTSNQFTVYTGQSLLYSTFDIYKSSSSSEIFFQKTPTLKTPTVEEMVAEEVPKMAEEVIQMMKIILLCGVGCLALLMALPVLLKVFYQFRLK